MLNITNFTVLNLTKDGMNLLIDVRFSQTELVSKFWIDVRLPPLMSICRALRTVLSSTS